MTFTPRSPLTPRIWTERKPAINKANITKALELEQAWCDAEHELQEAKQAFHEFCAQQLNVDERFEVCAWLQAKGDVDKAEAAVLQAETKRILPMDKAKVEKALEVLDALQRQGVETKEACLEACWQLNRLEVAEVVRRLDERVERLKAKRAEVGAEPKQRMIQ